MLQSAVVLECLCPGSSQRIAPIPHRTHACRLCHIITQQATFPRLPPIPKAERSVIDRATRRVNHIPYQAHMTTIQHYGTQVARTVQAHMDIHRTTGSTWIQTRTISKIILFKQRARTPLRDGELLRRGGIRTRSACQCPLIVNPVQDMTGHVLSQKGWMGRRCRSGDRVEDCLPFLCRRSQQIVDSGHLSRHASRRTAALRATSPTQASVTAYRRGLFAVMSAQRGYGADTIPRTVFLRT